MIVGIADIETDGLDPTVIHCLCLKLYDTDSGVHLGNHTFSDLKPGMILKLPHIDKWVFHNGLGFDVPVLNKFLPNPTKAGTSFINPKDVWDTLVISKLINYKKFRTHSLKELGTYLGVHKGDFTGPWDKRTKEMVDYCEKDVEVTLAVFKHYQKYLVGREYPDWTTPMYTEHKMASICHDMSTNGFSFNEEKAVELLFNIKKEMGVLESSFARTFEPKREELKRIKYRKKDDGTLYSGVAKAIRDSSDYIVDTTGTEDMLVVYWNKPFKPSSPKGRIDRLWEAGWLPWDKTDGHKKFIRECWMSGKAGKVVPDKVNRKDHYDTYGWKCNEDNLKTLPSTAPDSIKDLTMWLTLEGRRSSAQEWLNNLNEVTGKIHGKFWPIGAWTQRMSHSGPNAANIFAVWPDDRPVVTPIDKIKHKYDKELRSCWTAPEGRYLVGTDADGIQLRILAHLMGSQDYVDAILKGDKKLGTDIHSVNKSALGPICKSRDDAKTFIYAWLLGAGIPKVASILGCTTAQAQQAVDNFLIALPELKKIKDIMIPRDARRGYFIGLDGRKVPCNSEHLMLAGYLQAGEAVIMKASNITWRLALDLEATYYKQVNFVHDEWVTECKNKDWADVIGKVQAKSIETVGKRLGLKCPLAGTYKIGRTWSDVH